jgi:hypothetical protein
MPHLLSLSLFFLVRNTKHGGKFLVRKTAASSSIERGDFFFPIQRERETGRLRFPSHLSPAGASLSLSLSLS